VFRPRLHNEILEIYAGILRIVINAPAHGAVASSNPLVVVNDAIRDTIERFETTGSPASLLAESEASRRGTTR
jgi:hypothetical protein